MVEETLTERVGPLLVEIRRAGDVVETTFRFEGRERCLLHWGLSRHDRAPWEVPPRESWPEGSRPAGEGALQTPFREGDRGGVVTIRLDRAAVQPLLNFVLFFPDEGRWDNNRGRNYRVRLPVDRGPSPAEALEEETRDGETLFREGYPVAGRRLEVALTKREGRCRIVMTTDLAGPLLLHWGVAAEREEWLPPPPSLLPEGTALVEGAAETPFTSRNGLNHLVLEFGEQAAPQGVTFVIKQPASGTWIKKGGRNFYIPVTAPKKPALTSLAEEIIRAETGDHSWTLMHRFNLCHDLAGQVEKDPDGLALLFTWLRFSALRQLDWQRRYNTKPRELAHAQDRLTLRLAGIFIREPSSREVVRLMLTTLGRGGEGQRIRDEILHIMHRHHIKEVAGHFLEEWHQKLHNNATADDIVICEAYLNFLKSDGDLDLFYRTLEAGGVTRERLEGFERPIKTPPDFVPHLKDALIGDFEEYLKLLKSVHSGTDLESAVTAARGLLDAETEELLGFILHHGHDDETPLPGIVEKTTRVRRTINARLRDEERETTVRDLLYLDLALEEFLRIRVEQGMDRRTAERDLVELAGLLIENMGFSHDNREIPLILREWTRLKETSPFTRDRALHARAVIERVERIIGAFTDHYHRLLQPKAELLGKAFGAAPWTITLFSEEVVRGRPAFALSLLLRHLSPLLRRKAGVADWQVISRGEGIGRVEVVEDLGLLEEERLDGPAVIIADRIRGDEEPPEGTTAVITRDTVDLVSHVAVRARNSGILFAVCHDRRRFEDLKRLKGRFLNFTVSASGDVVFEEARRESVAALPRAALAFKKIPLPPFTSYVIPAAAFREGLVGGKSNNLVRLRERLPGWIHVPRSVAIPFGVFEEVLAMDRNREIKSEYERLTSGLDGRRREILAGIRRILLDLAPPDELPSALRRVMEEEGLPWPDDWDETWMCIKRVWASKWNERAYLSRKARGIADDDLFMAVLIQEVVEGEYSFVIHTVNPLTADGTELYAEVVPGLGETLVGNYPGRALGFTCGKETLRPRLLSYPSKSTALFGRGLIFRSDSNGEDLAGYAGAGLYDSVILGSTEEVVMDYSDEPLLWDEGFRMEILTLIARVGVVTEEAAGAPQDIEGSYVAGRCYMVQTRPQ